MQWHLWDPGLHYLDKTMLIIIYILKMESGIIPVFYGFVDFSIKIRTLRANEKYSITSQFIMMYMFILINASHLLGKLIRIELLRLGEVTVEIQQIWLSFRRSLLLWILNVHRMRDGALSSDTSTVTVSQYCEMGSEWRAAIRLCFWFLGKAQLGKPQPAHPRARHLQFRWILSHRGFKESEKW